MCAGRRRHGRFWASATSWDAMYHVLVFIRLCHCSFSGLFENPLGEGRGAFVPCATLAELLGNTEAQPFFESEKGVSLVD